MTTIELTTTILAPVKEVFDRSRDIGFHMESASQTQEKAIAGVTLGLIGLGETVTWRGKHFGIWLTHESLISEFNDPCFFVDEMIAGNFKNFRHEHHFTTVNNKTVMKDILSYELPYGIFGKLINRLLIKRYLTHFLQIRNKTISESLMKQEHL